MLDILGTLKNTPLPVILTLGGIVFLFLGIVGNIKQLTTEPLPKPARKWAAGTGAALLVAGVILYLIPAGAAGLDVSSTLTPTEVAAVPQQPAAETVTPSSAAAADTPLAETTQAVNAQGYPTMADDTGAMMVQIPGGNFLMGTEHGLGDEAPVRSVTLTHPYWLDVYEVSNQQYKACVDTGICPLPGKLSSHNHESYFGSPDFVDFPVTNVSWDMADTFCTKYRGGRLPTEAEWEFAARGSDQRPYPWGVKAPDCNVANIAVTTDNICAGDTQPVANYSQGVSPFGIYNMAGNVWEWVSDWYGPYNGLPNIDPTGNSAGALHILRGGGWSSDDQNTTSTVRYRLGNSDFDETFGIRCARNQ